MLVSRWLASGWLASGWLVAPPAHAHINLLEPVVRVPGFPESTLARGPCGQDPNERIEDRVNVFRPGESIELAFEVYVQHPGYFRISFDPEGDDSFSTRPSAPSDASTDDPTQLSPGDGEIILDYISNRAGDIDRVERRVTLPDIECDRCTLQVTLFVYGWRLDEALFYQCADLLLDDGDGVIEGLEEPPALDASDPLAAHGTTGCSLGAATTSPPPGSEGRSVWLVALAGVLRFGARRQRAGRDSIHSRRSST